MGFKTKEKAEHVGKEALEKMKGNGWKLNVWENIGWHFNLTNGPIAVHYFTSDGHFSCLLSDHIEDPIGGSSIWTTHFSHKDPNKVVEHEVKNARKCLNALFNKANEAAEFAEKVVRTALFGE